MNSFVAIDVETANGAPTSVCSIGATKVVDGLITDHFYQFVRPYPNYYYRRFTEEIHGISRTHTDKAPLFPQVWADLRPFIGTLPLVAHNKRFDEGCIRACHRYYGMEYPDYHFFCTLEKARKMIPRSQLASYSLPYLCDFLAIPFDNHHNALADADACAKIAMVLFGD